MSLFQSLITEIQISNPLEPAMDHNSIKLMVLLPAIYFRSLRYETPCITYIKGCQVRALLEMQVLIDGGPYMRKYGKYHLF